MFRFFVILLIATSFLATSIYAQLCDNGQVVELSQGKSCLFGYKFDGPVERGTWRSIWWLKSGGKVTDCNSYCEYLGNGKGKCKSSAGEDISTWCGGKSTCTCG